MLEEGTMEWSDIKLVHSPREIISTVCDFPYKIIEKCFQENALNITLMAK